MGTGDITIDQTAMTALRGECRQALDAINACNDRFGSEPIPPSGAPPAVQAMVVKVLSELFEKCLEKFREGEERMSKLCDDVDAACAAYEQMDEQNGNDVATTATKGTADAAAAAPGTDGTSSPDTAADSSSTTQQEQSTTDASTPAAGPGNLDTQEARIAAAQDASAQFKITNDRIAWMDGFEVRQPAADYALVERNIDLEARRANLEDRARVIAASLSPEQLATQTQTAEQIRHNVKLGQDLERDIEAYRKLHNKFIATAEANQRLVAQANPTPRSYSSDD